MLKPVAFANAFAVVGLALFIICRVVSLVAPDLLFTVGQSWFHTFSLSSAREVAPMDLGVFLLGGVTSTALTWLVSYSGASLYNKWAK
ncbi:hypothetical protein HYS93_04295 [Candidatus Daviesbacteria bacterium]|nr:hypothetical protein [Candidatus Daviesbacteria bacterium]